MQMEEAGTRMIAFRSKTGFGWLACLALSPLSLLAQPVPVQPLRTPPVERLTVSLRFRDWGATTIAGNTILAGNQTGQGGLFAVDTVTGKLKWSYRPTSLGGSSSTHTPPAVSGNLVVVPFSMSSPGAVVAVSLASGKEVWRALDPAVNAVVAAARGAAFVFDKNGSLYALDAATGREIWKTVLHPRRASCVSAPVVRDDTVYVTGAAEAIPGNPARPAGNYLFALDARTGQERWRYRAEEAYAYNGVCLHQPVVTADTIFAAGGSHIYAIRRDTGTDLWKPVAVRRVIDGRDRPADVHVLVDAGPLLVGNTAVSLTAFDKASGRTLWDIPGQYYENDMAVAGNVLYFQGSPASKPSPRGTLHALDLDTRNILWSFSRPTGEPNWPFGYLTPIDGGLWVDSYQALVKLQ